MSVTHMSMGYDFGRIEPKWQQFWERQRSFRALNPGPVGEDRPKFYVLDFFPYPSGAGLHVGHPLGYIASDILARHMRMRGYNVLHPMGWDAFGLPAEQYAIETGIHPAITTRKNIENYKRQLCMIGLGYDWDREITTCDPDYYRWTQWIFLQIFNSWYDPEWRWVDGEGRPVQGRARRIEELPIPEEVRAAGELALEEYRNEHRLAFRAEVPVNWCPALGTVLANEEVTADGRSERGDHPVYRRPLKQWMLRITEYADRLLSDLEPLDWPEPIKLMQRNWIGRSTGAYVDFRLEAGDHVIRVFTTRPDTLFGATYMVLAPEHRLVPIITTAERRTEVETYVEEARKRGELERSAEVRTKTGVFTGGYAVNPVNRQRIPIWVADYVLAGYGTGSIMAVPGHDQRDLEFARTFGLPVVQVVQPPHGVDWQGFEGDGVAMASPPTGAAATDGCDINGLSTPDAKKKITAWLEEHELGEGTVQYKLRDWLFSRQRYWGEPFPIAYAPDGRILGIPDAQLPVELPAMEDFRPVAGDDPRAEPQTPLSRAGTWAQFTVNGQVYRRELNTMPQWAGSCWYYLRFIDAENAREFVDARAERYWMTGCADKRPSTPHDAAARPGSQGRNPGRIGGVDLYIGGAEHAVLHLLYARFWHKVLYDLGHVSTPEPFQKLFNQGMIQAAAFRDSRGVYVEATEVVDDAGHRAVDVQDKSGPFFHGGRPVTREFGKMGKSLKNVVNPDAIIAEYGADTLRLYEMYMGPLEASKPWNTRDMIGVHRFLQRVWRLVVEEERHEGAEGSAAVPPATGSAAVPPNKMGSAGVPPATGSAAVPPNKMGSAGVPPATDSRISARIAAVDNPELEKSLHKAIKKVSEDLERFAFNTAIAQLIVWCNEAQRASQIGHGQVARFLRLLAPFAPHICEELWERLGQSSSITQAEWPMFDEALTRDATVEIAVQVNGKIRARLQSPLDADDQTLTALALADETVKRFVGGQALRKTVVVRNRLVNFIL